MIVLIQRVKNASVKVGEDIVGAIGPGILAFVGLEKNDDRNTVDASIKRLLSYRVFADEAGKMNLSLRDVGGGLLLVSQFTLAADTHRGLRPSFSSAMPPEQASELFAFMVDSAAKRHHPVASGRFGVAMEVSLINDGPVTFIL